MSDSENERVVISMEGMVYIDEYPHSSENTYHLNDHGYNSINLRVKIRRALIKLYTSYELAK